MARQPRFNIAGVAQHVVIRGNNRSACFFDDNDRRAYLHWLHEAAAQQRVAVHAYVLMTNHVHLLLTPEQGDALSPMIQLLGRRYVPYINRKYSRSGTLYEGRYKACVVDGERYMLTVYRYIDLNPVRARVVKHPRDFRWSSYGANAGFRTDPLIRPHDCYSALGSTGAQCAARYRLLCDEAIETSELSELRSMSSKQLVFGGEALKDEIAKLAQRRTRPARRT